MRTRHPALPRRGRLLPRSRPHRRSSRPLRNRQCKAHPTVQLQYPPRRDRQPERTNPHNRLRTTERDRIRVAVQSARYHATNGSVQPLLQSNLCVDSADVLSDDGVVRVAKPDQQLSDQDGSAYRRVVGQARYGAGRNVRARVFYRVLHRVR